MKSIPEVDYIHEQTVKKNFKPSKNIWPQPLKNKGIIGNPHCNYQPPHDFIKRNRI